MSCLDVSSNHSILNPLVCEVFIIISGLFDLQTVTRKYHLLDSESNFRPQIFIIEGQNILSSYSDPLDLFLSTYVKVVLCTSASLSTAIPMSLPHLVDYHNYNYLVHSNYTRSGHMNRIERLLTEFRCLRYVQQYKLNKAAFFLL